MTPGTEKRSSEADFDSVASPPMWVDCCVAAYGLATFPTREGEDVCTEFGTGQ